MKKTITTILAVLILSFPTLSYAQTSTQKAGMTPDNPLYFFDTLGEKIVLWLSFKPEAKLKLHLKYAEERTAEIAQLASENKSKYLDKPVSNFKENMEKASAKLKDLEEKGKDVTELAIKLEENALRQQNVLHRVLTQVPEQAKDAIQRAIDVSKNGLEQAAEAIQKKR